MRESGILMPVSALPSPYGIGTFGKAAYDFCDFLARAGQKLWQVLPLGPTSYGDSPYQSFSTFAGNPYFIDLEMLAEAGLLLREEFADIDWGGDPEAVDYETLYHNRFPVLQRAFDRFSQGDTAAFAAFRAAECAWIEDYALFMALKELHGGAGWQDWAPGYRLRTPTALREAAVTLAPRIDFYAFLQYLFFEQWGALKSYAGGLGIRIVGDLPIYVAPDSADVWVNPALFDLDDERNQNTLAGYPPDAFSDDGQLWGNPVYRWEVHAETGYAWWIARLRAAITLFDFVRLDHFIGFESFYAIPAGSTTAQEGVWRRGPGLALFHAAEAALGPLPLIAEDLGQVSPEARALLRDSGFPGMKMLEFAFGEYDSEYMPHNYGRHCVVYAGTHDNPPIRGWYAGLPVHEQRLCAEYLGLEYGQDVVRPLLRLMQSSVADTAVMQMQDVLELGSEARTNTPGTLGDNWKWRMLPDAADNETADRVRALCALYGRV